MRYRSSKSFYAFIDASNLFYGGLKSLGWKIDYEKLISYIKQEYLVKKVFYYGGIETHGFKFNILDNRPFPLEELLAYLKFKSRNKKLKKNYYLSLASDIKRVKFYLKLIDFGYKLRLKPVKTFREDNGKISKKANCDVDMTFDLMKYFSEYDGALILSGDGDFVTVLRYLIQKNKTIKILARGERTAREIKQLVGSDFRDFVRLRSKLEFTQK